MILVCPTCDAKFKIPDGAIPAEGRTVRCAKCKNSWHAKPNDIMRKQAAARAAAPRPAAPRPAQAARPAPRPAPPAKPHENFDGQVDPAVAAETEALRRSVRTVVDEPELNAPKPALDDGMFEDDEPSSSVSGNDDSDDFGISAAARAALGDHFDDVSDDDDQDTDDDYDDEDYDDDDFLARRRADQRRQSERDASERRQRLVTGAWAGLVLFWGITFYVFVFEKERMIYKFPGTQSFYSMFEGVSDKERFQPEEGETLTPSPAKAEVYISAKLDNTRTKVEQVNGKSQLMVHGFVENLGTTGANVPQVLVQIVDANNNVLDQWVTEPAGLLIRRGGRVNFVTSRDVPIGIASVQVEVIEGSKSSTSGELR
ncbi:MAG: zinc-ribbon domain-containing protein [Kordiimonas sp.]